MNPPDPDTENIEMDLLLEAIWRKYGYDFRQYARAAMKRRLSHIAETFGCPTLSLLQHKVLHEAGGFQKWLAEITITVTEMFRDPPFFRLVAAELIPMLKTYPFPKIWVAGCATGEEAYALAILLHEADLLRRATIYATDVSETALEKARAGIYPLDRIRAFTINYQRAGGLQSFADYYTGRYEHGLMRPFLRRSMVFGSHNLVTDQVFGEMNMICCRNVMIYFNAELKHRVMRIFLESLAPQGFLCLGMKENPGREYAQVIAEYNHVCHVYQKTAHG